jgi:mono/diheme cytochrome c family protein
MRLTRCGAAVGLVLVAAVDAAADEGTRDDITYADDIRPIFEARCVQCHQPGSIAPMSLRSYPEVRPWVKSIAREVVRRQMPPFHAAGTLGRYKNDIRLTDAEIDLIAAWAERGAPQGAPAAAAAPAAVESGDWFHGTPDIVIEFPDYAAESSEVNRDPYVYLFTDFAFEEDLWVRGFEWKFSDRGIVHHAMARQLAKNFEIPESRVVPNLSMPVNASIGLSSWFPGQTAQLLPEHTARLVRAGVRPVVSIHFAPRGESARARTQLGVYLFDGELRHSYERLRLSVKDRDLLIPPHADDHTRIVLGEFPGDAWVHSFYVHMHYRGKSAQLKFHYPDGHSEVVFELPRFSFDWQRVYELDEPLRAPQGTKMEAVLVWDNSAANPINPDPSRQVVYGPNSDDEMGGIVMTIASIPEVEQSLEVTRGRAANPMAELPDHFRPPHEKAMRDALNKMRPEERSRVIREALESQKRPAQ